MIALFPNVQAVQTASDSLVHTTMSGLLVVAIGGIAKLALDHRSLETRVETLMRDREGIQEHITRSSETNATVRALSDRMDQMMDLLQRTARMVDRMGGAMEERNRAHRKDDPD